jgi:tRNA 5-methylaminomethyl-2-thiouridine biosynthesis bifunctional protein
VADAAFFATHYADLSKGKPPAHYPAAEYLYGLYVNTGHGARGLTSALLAAELISSLLNQTPLPMAETIWQAVNPARFQLRDLKTAG